MSARDALADQPGGSLCADCRDFWVAQPGRQSRGEETGHRDQNRNTVWPQLLPQ
jgi:hypothetical protein